MNNERLADLFIDQGLMDRAQADDVLLETTQNGKAIDQAMVDHGIVDEAQFYKAIAEALGTEVVDLDQIEFTPQILRLIPAGLARLHRALPIGEADNAIRVALVDPLDTQTIEDLRFALGRDMEVVLAPSLQIEERRVASTASAGHITMSTSTLADNAGMACRRRCTNIPISITEPIAAARNTLGDGCTITTNANSVTAASATATRGPTNAAPSSTAPHTMVTFAPDTAVR